MMFVDRLRAHDQLKAELSKLDALPPRVSYYDPYSEAMLVVEQADAADQLAIAVSGTRLVINLLEIPEPLRELHRRMTLWALQRHAPSVVKNFHAGIVKLLASVGEDAVLYPFVLDPIDVSRYWHEEILPFLKSFPHSYRAAKLFLRFLCHNEMGCLTRNDGNFIRSFRGPAGNLYKSIEVGEVFLSLAEQGAVVRYLDGMALAVRQGEPVSADDLREASVLICAMEHAMRAIQISKVLPNDVRVRKTPGLNGGMAVHVRFHMEKQISERKKLPMLRKISLGWVPIFKQFEVTSRDVV